MQQRGPQFDRPASAGPEIGPYEPKLPPAAAEQQPEPSLLGRLKRIFTGPPPRPGFSAPHGWRTRLSRTTETRRQRRRDRKARSRRRPDDFTWPGEQG